MADSALAASSRVGHLEDETSLVEFLKRRRARKSGRTWPRPEGSGAGQRKQKAQQYAEVVRSGRGQSMNSLCRPMCWPSRASRSKAAPAGTTREPVPTTATGIARPRNSPRTASTWSCPICCGVVWPTIRATCCRGVTTFEKHGDQIAQCLAAAKKYGLQVHVWKVNCNLSTAPREFIDKIRREHRNQVSVNGEAENWLCPSHPENFQLELDSMLEVARKYEVDGLHFDYIRYPDQDKCYCDGCRSRFEEQTGAQVQLADRLLFGRPARPVCAVALRPDHTAGESRARRGQENPAGIAISAAVFGAYPSCRESVAQDWPEWIKAGTWTSSVPWTIRKVT